jgi:hypothetical protein
MKGVKGGIGNLLLGRGGFGMGGERGGRRGGGEEWDELDVGGLVEMEKGKEVPPGMAVSFALITSLDPSLSLPDSLLGQVKRREEEI